MAQARVHECPGFTKEITSLPIFVRVPSLKAGIMSGRGRGGDAGDKNVEVGRDAEQELRGNGAAVEKSDEMGAPVPEQPRPQPQPQPPAAWQGDAYVRILVKVDQALLNMSIQRQMIKS